MLESKKKVLNLLDKAPLYTYRISFKNINPKDLEGNRDPIKKLFESSSDLNDAACWASYLRNKMPNDRFRPIIIDLKLTWNDCEVTSFLTKNPEFTSLHDLLVERILSELEPYLYTEYDKKNQLLLVNPKDIKYRAYMLLLLTKLRHIFEQPFVLTSMFAPIFQDDFPELNFDQISYLLEVYVKKGNSGHSLHRPSNSFGGGNTVYMTLDEMVKRAATGKFDAIHDSYDGATILFKEENPTPFGKTGLPNKTADRYNLIVENKDLLINRYFKIHEHKKSVPSRHKRVNLKVA